MGADNARISAGECPQDLGFSGPGSASLSICGDVLATGKSAQLQLDGVLPSTVVD